MNDKGAGYKPKNYKKGFQMDKFRKQLLQRI